MEADFVVVLDNGGLGLTVGFVFLRHQKFLIDCELDCVGLEINMKW